MSQSDGDDSLTEQTLDSRLAFEGTFLRLFVDTVKSADGHIGTREYLRHPGARNDHSAAFGRPSYPRAAVSLPDETHR